MTSSTTPNAKQELDLNHLKDARSVLKWCYDHGLLKGEFPDSDSSNKSYVLDEAEKRLSELLKPLVTDHVNKALKNTVDDILKLKQNEHSTDPLTGEPVETYGYEATHNQALDQALSAIERVRKEWS